MTVTDTRPYTFQFTVSREACDVLGAMRAHVQQIGIDWGQSSPEYREAAESLARQVVTMFASPWTEDTRITPDGPLSLLVTGGITYGVIWHGKRRHCTAEGCHAVINDDGKAWSYDSNRFPMLEHEHTPDYPLTAAQPGSWSFHS